MFVYGTQFSSWLWLASVMGLRERSLSRLGPSGPVSLGASVFLMLARWMPAPGDRRLAHPAHLSSHPGTNAQPMPPAEPALPDGTGGNMGA